MGVTVLFGHSIEGDYIQEAGRTGGRDTKNIELHGLGGGMD